MFFKIGFLKNFANFKGKELCWSLFLIQLQASCNFIKKRLQHRCFLLKFAKFFMNTFFAEHLRQLLLLLRYCLIHITIILLRHILYLVYLCPCLGLGLLMSYLCDPFFIFSLILIVINHITSFKQMYLFFVHF